MKFLLRFLLKPNCSLLALILMMIHSESTGILISLISPPSPPPNFSEPKNVKKSINAKVKLWLKFLFWLIIKNLIDGLFCMYWCFSSSPSTYPHHPTCGGGHAHRPTPREAEAVSVHSDGPECQILFTEL